MSTVVPEAKNTSTTFQRSRPVPPLQRGTSEARTPSVRSDINVMLVASNGGHLAQLMALRGWWAERDRSWVCFDKADARSQLANERTVWAHWPTTRNLPNLLKNFVLAVKTIRAERPDVVVSTGAAVAFPFFLVARLMRIPTVFIEVYDRVDSRTLSGRLCLPISTHFLVQWPEQQALYRGSIMVGPLL
jgi:UDP-N-acetylglucosamine:LPS N-acetylglucosamine transferase